MDADLQQWNDQVVRDNEVLLYGTRYPLLGIPRRRSITPFPPQYVIGDYSQGDRIIESERIFSDYSGGVGVQVARAQRDEDRTAMATLETKYRYLTLGAQKVLAVESYDGAVGELHGHVVKFLEFNGDVWAVQEDPGSSGVAGVPNRSASRRLWRWDFNNNRWVQPTATRLNVGTGTAGATQLDWSLVGGGSETYRDALAHDGKIYVLTSHSLYAYSPTSSYWEVHSNTPEAMAGWALASFDDKLWRLTLTNELPWVVTPTGVPVAQLSWSSNPGRLQMPAGHCRQLVVFWDQTGNPRIHAITKHGVYGFLETTAKFYPTPLTHPPLDAAGRGACVWRGALYVPAGSSIYKMTGEVVSVVGPDKDDGLPTDLRGDVTQVVPGHGFYYCVVTALTDSGVNAPPMQLGIPDTQFLVPGYGAVGTVLTSPESSWHGTAIFAANESRGTNTPVIRSAMKAAACLGVSNTLRLWISTDTSVFWVAQPTGLHNPLFNPIQSYAEDGWLDTPWDDLRWSEMDKVALSLEVDAIGLYNQASVTLRIGYDEDPTWHHVGTLSTPGRKIFRLGGVEGRLFRSVRLRIEMVQGKSGGTPVVRNVNFGYMRAPDKLDGFDLQLNLTDPLCKDDFGVPAGDLVQKLFDDLRAKKAGQLSYRRAGTEPIVRRVWLHQVSGAELSGDRVGGMYNVSVIELDT